MLHHMSVISLVILYHMIHGGWSLNHPLPHVVIEFNDTLPYDT